MRVNNAQGVQPDSPNGALPRPRPPATAMPTVVRCTVTCRRSPRRPCVWPRQACSSWSTPWTGWRGSSTSTSTGPQPARVRATGGALRRCQRRVCGHARVCVCVLAPVLVPPCSPAGSRSLCWHLRVGADGDEAQRKASIPPARHGALQNCSPLPATHQPPLMRRAWPRTHHHASSHGGVTVSGCGCPTAPTDRSAEGTNWLCICMQ